MPTWATARVHRSWEAPDALGTAGALGALRPWIDGRGALVVNADSWSDADLSVLTDGWDGRRVRVLMARLAPGAPGAPAPCGSGRGWAWWPRWRPGPR